MHTLQCVFVYILCRCIFERCSICTHADELVSHFNRMHSLLPILGAHILLAARVVSHSSFPSVKAKVSNRCQENSRTIFSYTQARRTYSAHRNSPFIRERLLHIVSTVLHEVPHTPCLLREWTCTCKSYDFTRKRVSYSFTRNVNGIAAMINFILCCVKVTLLSLCLER